MSSTSQPSRKREHEPDDETKDMNGEKKSKHEETLPTPAELTDDQVIAQAREYVKWERGSTSRDVITSWLSSNDISSLRTAFIPRIAFGTAGLRARMAPGYHFMNQLVVIQTTQGLVRYIQQQNKECTKQGIILGYDGRHNSQTYAHLVAAIFLSQNIPVYLYKEHTATPFVPFGVLEFKAAAGVMITASHNPKDDNGYKLYWSNGCQIIPPHDAAISSLIDANLEPWDVPPFNPNHELLHDPTQRSYDKYFSESAKRYSYVSPDINRASTLRVTFTAMHGVGAPFTARALSSFHLPSYIPVKQQVEVDPEFPTVKFPNPEEGKGALALSMETANRENSTLILANDPDADRLAIAEKQSSGEWRIFTGNEIALLLAGWIWSNYTKQNPDADKSKACMVASTVSSKALKAMAHKEGFKFVGTLTGFKWIGNAASDMISQGHHFLFAYEVEIGFLVGNLSLDKDGIRTSAVFYEMANHLHSQGKTCTQYLEELYQTYGYFVMNTSYFFNDQPAKMNAIFHRLRTMNNGTYPDRCDKYEIISVRDCTLGYDSNKPGNVSILPKTPESQMITFRFANGTTTTLRGSGTEPKLKYYVECNAPTRAEAAKLTAEMTRVIINEFLQPHVHGLIAQGATAPPTGPTPPETQ